MTRTYQIQIKVLDHWSRHIDESLSYCQGYMEAMRDQGGPFVAMRLMRSDGKVVDEIQELTEVSIGMVAGYPTAEQYEAATERALEKAKVIREREARSLAKLERMRK